MGAFASHVEMGAHTQGERIRNGLLQEVDTAYIYDMSISRRHPPFRLRIRMVMSMIQYCTAPQVQVTGAVNERCILDSSIRFVEM